MPSACILGCAGPVLTPEEQALFAEADPFGFILYGRNIVDPAQVRALVAALRASVGRPDAPVLVDQEGGRVQRLGPPHWRRYPPAAAHAALDPQVARDAARVMAAELQDLGIDVACAPVLDLRLDGASDVIGDRAFGGDPGAVADLARVWCEGLLAGGVLPVLKHMPGHGRARVDSHLALPVVEASLPELETSDFAPFRANADAPVAMTAHVVFAAVDPDQPATTSRILIRDVIRGRIGFDGLLLSDDLAMSALTGDLGTRAARATAAGCDVVIYGAGEVNGGAAVAAGAGRLAGDAARRAAAALARRRAPGPFDAVAAGTRLDAAFGGSSPQ